MNVVPLNIDVLYDPTSIEKEDGPPTLSTEKALDAKFILQDERSLN
jgi:hypothetical protein